MLAKNIIAFFTALLLLASCSLPQLSKEAPALNEVLKNTRFKINLPEDHTTGYLWQLSPDFDRNVLQELNAVWHGNDKGIDFNFKSQKAGQTELHFVLRKHTDTLAIKHFIVKILDK